MARTRTGLAGLVMVGLVVLSALVSLFWTPFNPIAVNPNESWLHPFQHGHILGTDSLGRDIFSQIMAGAQTTLLTAVGSAALAGVLGVTLAVLATTTPRPLGEPIARFTDLLIAFPALLIAIVLAAVYGGSTVTAIVAIGVAAAVQIARVTRTEIARIIGSDYVLAGRASGSSTVQIVRRHVLPNIASTVIVQLSLVMALAVLVEAALAYLGYGTPPPTPSWGRMLYEIQQNIQVQPLVVVWPGLAIALTVLGFNLLGDGLREALDPQLAQATGGVDLNLVGVSPAAALDQIDHPARPALDELNAAR